MLLAGGAICEASEPGGEVFELHACELYTGGCTASAEATLEGRSLLRVWKFTSGSWDGVDLAGLPVAAIETADTNLAANRDAGSRAVIYLPSDATREQRDALANWARERGVGARAEVVAIKSAPIRITGSGDRRGIAVGEAARLTTGTIAPCTTGSCGESMWYAPRSAHGEFRALLEESAVVSEPALSLEWRSSGLRSVFAASFGDSAETVAALANQPR